VGDGAPGYDALTIFEASVDNALSGTQIGTHGVPIRRELPGSVEIQSLAASVG
jgi:hypothetical protein